MPTTTSPFSAILGNATCSYNMGFNAQSRSSSLFFQMSNKVFTPTLYTNNSVSDGAIFTASSMSKSANLL